MHTNPETGQMAYNCDNPLTVCAGGNNFEMVCDLKETLFETLSSLKRNSAQLVFEKTGDEREAYLVALMQQMITSGTQNSTLPCVKFMLQYHVEACRLAISCHLASPFNPVSGPSVHTTIESWQKLEPFLQHLQQQRLRLRQFLSTLHKARSCLKDDLAAFDAIIEEIRIVVDHKRQRLDHELNIILTRESKASLQVANQTIRESRGTKLCT